MAEPSELMRIFDHDEKFKGLMKRLLEITLQNSFDAMMITENKPGYPVVFVNPAFTRLTGYGNRELIGKSPAVLQGPKTDREVLERLSNEINAGKIFHGVAVNYRKDGSEFVMEWKIAPIRNERDEISHFLAIQRDVTPSTTA